MTNVDKSNKRYTVIKLVIVSAAAIAMGTATYFRNTAFHDAVTSWLDVIKKSPFKGRAFNALGHYYLDVGDYINAANNFRESIRRNPGFDPLYLDLASAYEGAGDFENARRALQQAMKFPEIVGRKKARFHIYLGDLYLKDLILPDALKEFTAAANMEPENDYIYHKMGLIFRAQGKYDEAIASFKKALELSPETKINKAYMDEVSKLKLKQLRK